VWPVVTYGCESWTLRKNKETRIDAFEMAEKLSFIYSKENNEWVLILNEAGVNRELYCWCSSWRSRAARDHWDFPVCSVLFLAEILTGGVRPL